MFRGEAARHEFRREVFRVGEPGIGRFSGSGEPGINFGARFSGSVEPARSRCSGSGEPARSRCSGSGEPAAPRRQSLLRSQARCALLPAATPRVRAAARLRRNRGLPGGRVAPGLTRGLIPRGSVPSSAAPHESPFRLEPPHSEAFGRRAFALEPRSAHSPCRSVASNVRRGDDHGAHSGLSAAARTRGVAAGRSA
jgi:hypothetical protein